MDHPVPLRPSLTGQIELRTSKRDFELVPTPNINPKE